MRRVSAPLGEIGQVLRDGAEPGDHPVGPQRITMPHLAADEIIMRRLPAFSAALPRIELDIRTSDRFEDIVLGGDDAGIRLAKTEPT